MKNIILTLILCSFTFLGATTYWIESEFQNIDRADQETTGIRTKIKADGELSKKLSFMIEDEFYRTDERLFDKNTPLFNVLKANLKYKLNNTFLKLQYRNNFNDNEDTVIGEIPGIENPTQLTMIHNIEMQANSAYNNLNFEIYAKNRNLRYKHYLTNNEENNWESDFYANIDAFYKFSDNIKVLFSSYYKNDLNESDMYDYTSIGTGFEIFRKFSLMDIAKYRFMYSYNNSKVLGDFNKHSFSHNLRYVKRFGANISGFISYINRFYFDEDKSEFYRLANVVRLHAKYNFLTQNLIDSYVLLGTKINPENETSVVFGELTTRLIKELYITAGTRHSFEFFTSYPVEFRYYLTSLNSIWFKGELIDYPEIDSQTILSVGASLIF